MVNRQWLNCKLFQSYLKIPDAECNKGKGHKHQDQCFFPDVHNSGAFQHDIPNDHDEPAGWHRVTNDSQWKGHIFDRKHESRKQDCWKHIPMLSQQMR